MTDLLSQALRDPLRQSRIARFDACPLSLRFDLETDLRQMPGQMGQLAARGALAHRAFAAAINHMRSHSEDLIGVDQMMELLTEVIAQRDVPDDEVVHLSMRELRWLRVLCTKWAYRHTFTIERVVAVERRLYADIEVVGPKGTRYTRTITGQPDVLLAGPGEHEATLLDWKAQPLDALVLTPEGFKPMGSLTLGDEVIGRSGKPTKVVGVYPQGRKEVFEIEFTDGSRTACCDDHLWSVTRNNVPRVLPLSEIRERTAGNYWQVPAVEPVEFGESAELPLDPYLLGVLLGDGCLRANGSVGLSAGDPEIIEAVRPLVGPEIEVKQVSPIDWVLTAENRPNPLRSILRDLDLLGKRSWEKHVPDRYLYASPEERLALLRGLMDTDGSIDRYNRIGFYSASEQLARAVRFLVWSLGGRATYKMWDRDNTHRPAHCIYFRLPVVPFALSRKVARWSPNKLTMNRGIRSVRSLGEKECQCIKVEAEDGLYVTDDFIVTHNTGWAPPAKRVEKKTDSDDRLSDMGYAQQVVYGWQVLKNYPSIQRVTEREFYVMHDDDPVREASVERSDMERIEDVLASVISRIDGALEGGPDSKRWFPIPGTHCAMCVRPKDCPIQEAVGIPTELTEAQRLAREWIVAAAVRTERLPYLKGWVDANGPIPIAHAKGRREVGWFPNKTGDGRSFKLFEPDDAPDSPFDLELETAARERGILEEAA